MMDLDERFQSRSEEFSDDNLLLQIDAFRDKARQLQNLITTKQRKVATLEATVRAREEEVADKEAQIAILQQELIDKQRQADGLVNSVELQVDRMLRTMRGDFADMSRRLEDVVTRAAGSEPAPRSYTAERDRYEEPRPEVSYRDPLSPIPQSQPAIQVSEPMEQVSLSPDTVVTAQISESSPLFDKMDLLANEIDALKQEIIGRNKEIEDLKKELKSTIGAEVATLKDSLAEAGADGASLTEVKEELSEKIHAENVKVFRNIQDTLKEMDLKEEVDLSMEVRYRSLRNRVFWTTSLLIVNVGISVVLLLVMLHII